jgi:hypothetical protein
MPGIIDSDGTIRNAMTTRIEHLPNVQKTWAAVAFFFFNFHMS